ncbi:hypothetical protein GSI_10893 [Ganoderma sinense ZZ0214-1]|uniref:DUF6589 domain-containing protein n=1 Tax=Ganoderma sinense ZZ0214-1 TaxID=1077348 RepID=A0A2G8S1T7_9APHY|nr:hypothetical protein GSI_10893 [Ganoderma sinense ZZ0214-1]
MNTVFDLLQSYRWSLGEFLYYVFRTHDAKGSSVKRSARHGSVVGNFLAGKNRHKAIEIVEFWVNDTAGRAKQDDPEFKHMYSPTLPYQNLKHARIAISAMCIQASMKQMRLERMRAVKGSSGLHGSAEGRRGRRQLSWEDIGSKTVSKVQDIIKTYQPVTYHIIKDLVSPRPYRNEHGVIAVRKTRPPEVVTTEILSIINFTHTKWARLLPAARAALFFACGVPRAVFDYASRIGLVQSWHATFNLLRRLAEKDAAYVKECGRSLVRWLILRFDNVQQFLRQRERRLGRENKMMVGVAGYVAEAFDFVPEVADLADHLERVRENKRADLTVAQLTTLVDWDHAEVVAALHWLQTLVSHVPALACYRTDVAGLFRTDGAKLVVPVRKTKVYPLGTVAKNEAVTTELRDTLVDFLKQMGQSREDYIPGRIIPAGGDGLTFEKLVQIRNYMQFEPTEYQRFEMLWPFLEVWHTTWTFLSTIFETHFGGTQLTDLEDPGMLGHSATKIDQKPPPNLKKVDYYPSLYTVQVVLDARMLDCWRIHFECTDLAAHFEGLAAINKLPALDELRSVARKLHQAYSTTSAWTSAMEGGDAAVGMGWKPGSRRWGEGEGERTEPEATGKDGGGAETVREEAPEDAMHREEVQANAEEGLDALLPFDANPPGAGVPTASHPECDIGTLQDTTDSQVGSVSPAHAQGNEDSEDSSSDSAESSDSEEEAPTPFRGDHSLARSISFMSDAVLVRDLSQAVAAGDIGRVWNDMKILAFRFAGSSHSKYMTYLLEMICILELESSPILRDTFLKNWLVNPSGEPDRNMEGDLFGEHINLILDEAMSRKGSEWDSPLLREVHAPNAVRFMELKGEWGTGVGLARRHGKHPDPHSRPELRTLLSTYQETQLHYFREGRSYDSKPSPNLMHEGIKALLGGKLKSWTQETTHARFRALAAKNDEAARRLLQEEFAKALTEIDEEVELTDSEDGTHGIEGEDTRSSVQDNPVSRSDSDRLLMVDGLMGSDSMDDCLWASYDVPREGMDTLSDGYNSMEEHLDDGDVDTDM